MQRGVFVLFRREVHSFNLCSADIFRPLLDSRFEEGGGGGICPPCLTLATALPITIFVLKKDTLFKLNFRFQILRGHLPSLPKASYS